MPTPQELKKKLWKSLKSDMTVMLGLSGIDDCHTRPMTAQVEGEEGPIWFFTANDTEIVKNLEDDNRAICTFASKGNDVFACIHGTLAIDNDRAVIDRLWNPFVAAWYEDGKNDPKLTLLKLNPENAEIWLNGSSIVAGIKLLLGADPKKEYKDHVAEVRLN